MQGVLQYAPTNHSRDEAVPAAPAFRSPSQTIGAIVRGFKAATTTQINALRATPSVPVWQRNYYEHVIRDERDLNRIRHYIENNPAHWATDDENPAIVRRAVPPPRKGAGR